MWFGTANGLNRFDGYTFTIYNYDPLDASSLSHPIVKCLLEDHNGMIWVGTQGGGLCKFDPQKARFTTWTHNPNDPASISHNEILSLLEDEAGHLWVGTENGLNLMDEDQKGFYHADPDPNNKSALAAPAVLTLHQDRKGRIWLGSWAGGLQVFYPQKTTREAASRKLNPGFISFPTDENISTYLGGREPWRVITDHAGRLWVATLGSGLWATDHELTDEELAHPDQVEFYKARLDSDNSVIKNRIHGIYEDQQHRMWAATNQGLCLSEPVSSGVSKAGFHFWLSNSWTHIQRLAMEQSAPLANYQLNINGDHNGTVWICSEAGISARKQTSAWAKTYLVATNFQDRIRVNDVRNFTTSSVLLATNRGVESFDLLSHKVELLNRTQNELLKALPDQQGQLWFSDGQNLYGAATVRAKPELVKLPIGNSGRSVRDIALRSKNELWIGAYSGVVRLNTLTGKLINWSYESANDSILIEKNWIYDIKFSSEDRVWLATENGGLLRAISSPEGTWSVKAFLPNPKDVHSFQNMNMNKIALVDSGVWLSSGSGLWFFNTRKESFVKIDNDHGLTPGAIKDLVVDKNGWVWCQVSQKIACMNPATGWFKEIGQENGLYTGAFNKGGMLVANDGRVLTGGDNGLAVMENKVLSFRESPPTVRIMDLRIFNNLVKVGEEDPWTGKILLERTLSSLNNIALSYKHSLISFDFSVLNALFPEKVEAAYRISGLSDDWTTIGTNRTISLTQLTTGSHVLEIRAANSEGEWGPTASLTIHITPPFWGTWWFRLLAIAVLAGIIVGLHLSKVKFIADRNTKLEEEVKSRTQELQLANSRERIARGEAESAAKAKSEFLSVMSHEIRTPLHAVISMSNHILDEHPRQDQMEYLKILKISSDHLLNLINNILDFSKIEAGKLEIAHQPFNLYELGQGLVQLLSIKAEEKPVEFIFDYDPALSHWFLGDQVRVGQVFTNLLGNAEKFTAEGRVYLRIQDSGAGSFSISVEDTGIGIPKSKHQQVFEPFAQSDLETSRVFGGTGLGLNISRRLLHMMGAELTLESEEGKGTSFSFTLSLPVTDAPAKTSIPEWENVVEQPLNGVRVLVVEDNLVNQKIANRYLQKWGACVSLAGNGAEAVRFLEINTVDIVLMDLQMPVMDGITATKILRSKGMRVPVVGLSAAVLEEEVKRMKESGMNDFVPKPYQPGQLLTSLIHLLQIQQEL